MRVNYRTSGVCADQLSFDLRDGRVYDLSFDGGCNGNGKGIAALAEGQPASELADKLLHVTCGGRSTSCPAQLALALKETLSHA